jgi:orotate phosphoribosyltransferase-like protein
MKVLSGELKMKKLIILFVLGILASALSVAAATSLKGTVSDKMCGADHHGKDPAACTLACVKHGSEYVLVVGKDKIYDIENQKDAKISAELSKFAGKEVTVTGDVSTDGKGVKVERIASK